MAKLTVTTCGHCGRPTIGGWTNRGEVVAMLVTVDPRPLSPVQELMAVVAGRKTWTLHGAGVLTSRPPWTIRQRPAGTRTRETVHADHSCTPTPWSWQ